MPRKISKQDRQGVRTPSDLEYKYAFTKNITGSVSAATEAQRAARESSAAVSSVSKSVDSIEQSVEKLADDVSKLFTKNHEMTGALTCTTNAFIPPGDVEIETITKHINGTAPIPSESISLYDFNNNGVIDSEDITLAKSFENDLSAFKAWQGAVAKSVTITLNLSVPERLIHFAGTNMWGRAVEGYVGINFTSVKNTETEQRLANLEQLIASLETKIGGEYNGNQN